MKIIKVNVDGQIKIDSIYDSDNKTSQTINTSLKIPAGNYKSVILDFNFISPSVEQDGLQLFAVFKTEHSENSIQVEIAKLVAEGNTYNNACFIPAEVLQETGKVSFGIYGYILNADESLKKRISLNPITHEVVIGSYDGNATDETIPTPTVFEVYFDKVEKANAKIEELLSKIDNVLINNKSTVIGENITIKDSAEARVEEIDVRGNSVQATRDGKNLLKNTATTQTLNGITFTVNSDGTVKVNGTATASTNLNIFQNISLEDGKTYKLSGCPSGGSDTSYALTMNQYYDSTSHYIQDYGNGASFIYNKSSESSNSIYIRIVSGATLNNIIFKPMIVEGTEAKEYEPYGIMPSPDYPSEINSCGDNVNLLDCSNFEIAYISSSGEYITSSKANVIWDFLEVTAGQNFTMSSNGTLYNICFYLFDKNKNFINRISINSTANKTVTIPEGCCFIRYSINYNGTTQPTEDIIKEIELKLEKGSKATPYTSYNQGCINETICNKNLYKLKESNYSALGVSVITNNNTLILNGTTNASGNLLPTYGDIDYHMFLGKFKAGTYTFSLKTSGSWSGSKNFAFYIKENANNAFLVTVTEKDIKNNSATYTFTLDEDKNLYLLAFVNSANMIFNNYTVDFQLEENTVSTEHVEHKSQTYTIPTQKPFRAIGDYKDTFVKQDGVWYEKHLILEEKLNGQSIIGFFETQGDYALFQVVINKGKLNANIKSDKIITKPNWGTNVESIWFGGSASDRFQIKILSSRLLTQSQSGVAQWLNENNIIVHYRPLTPVYIPCTAEQVIKLNEIQALAKTYKNTTHIFSEDEVSPEIEVTYYKDVETMLNNS